MVPGEEATLKHATTIREGTPAQHDARHDHAHEDANNEDATPDGAQRNDHAKVKTR